MGINISKYADELIVQAGTEILIGEDPVDAMEFVTSAAYLSEDPFPSQRIILKTLYGLWDIYPPDQEEEQLLKLLENKWRIPFEWLNPEFIVEVLVLCLGRRSAKSTLASFLATYAMYTLICRGNPQKYYGIRERHPIHIVHVASAGKQAASMFTLTADNIKKVPFFRPYIDFDKDNTTELRLFSPYDLIQNKKIRARNAMLPKGVMKENTLPGSLNIRSITSSAASSRGDAIFMLIFSEFAHMQRAKYEGNKSGDQIAEENPQSDYALFKALSPSVKDFGEDGKIICESSPAEKGGQFYFEYCTAGGWEQDGTKNPQTGLMERLPPERGYALIQLATWEARPTMPRETFDKDFRKDPRGANMEYGAHFGNPSGQFIEESVIKKIPIPGRPLIRKNPGTWKFVISLDPGGKAKDKKDDTYALGWAHYEGQPHEDESTYQYWIDGFEGWNAEIKDLGGGVYEQIPVDPNKVLSFLVDLVKDLGGRNFIHEITYDQWNSQSSIATLQSLGLPAVETTFTNPYKADMYGDFLEKAQLEQVKMYGEDTKGWVDRWMLEMKYLQQIISGKVVYYRHPSTGPVQTDDFADVGANLIHRLVRIVAPSKQSIKNNRKLGVPGGFQKRKTVSPVRGPSLHKGSSTMFPKYRGRN